MSIHAVDTTFTQFLNPNETKIYTIPIYQREYSWKQEHCEALLNDIQENDPNYFIGSIIWVENTNEVIDNEMIVLSTSIEPAKGAGKMVHELTIYRKGGMSSVIK